MNALTASFIVTLIGATAFIVVAVITAHARIGLLPAIVVRDSSNPGHVPINLPESAKKFRVLGWMLVLLLYLAATFCLLQGLNRLLVGTQPKEGGMSALPLPRGIVHRAEIRGRPHPDC